MFKNLKYLLNDCDKKETKCNKKCDKKKCCDLTTDGTHCQIENFVLSEANLPYEKCQTFPCLIKKFIKSVGIDTIIKISESLPIDGDRAAGINAGYSSIENFIYKGYTYNIRMTLTRTDGKVIYDSAVGKTDITANLQPLHTTRMEIQRATETAWGAMRRSSNTVGVTSLYASIWIPNIILINNLADINGNIEVINFRFSYLVDNQGNPIPIVL